MAYKILRFEKERTTVDGRSLPMFVAVIQKDGQEAPFRVTIENFDTVQAALNEVARWIATQELDEANGLAEKEIIEKELQGDRVLEELSQDFDN